MLEKYIKTIFLFLGILFVLSEFTFIKNDTDIDDNKIKLDSKENSLGKKFINSTIYSINNMSNNNIQC